MIKDRLHELRLSSELIAGDSVNFVIETPKSEEKLYDILNKFHAIRTEIQLMNRNVEQMKKIINEQQFHYKDKNIRESMEKLISESLSHSQNVHKAIKKFQGESNASNNSRIVNRIINYQLALIKNEYLIVYHEHSVFVEKYEEKLKKILKREAFIMSHTLSIDESEDLLPPTHDTSMFVGNILEETRKAQDQLREIVQRHEMLVSLEKSLQEVYDMFVHISTFVMEQGSLIQVIEYETEQAIQNVDKGADELEEARELKRKAKKKCVLIAIIVGVAIFVLLLIIF